MAYLNVRERRLEAKIAYVGPALAGKATNIRSLKNDVARGRASNLVETAGASGDLVSIDWMPLHLPRFNDCDLSVKVIAARGDLSSDQLGDLFEDVDGVVVVVDAAASAEAENRRAVDLVREVLKERGKDGPERPVVVQVNKIDQKDARAASEWKEALATDAWPVVAASATRGDGVVETLEMALTSVLEAIKARSTEPDVKADHNPLLTALRQILRDTVTEHMATIEQSIFARLPSAVGEEVAKALASATPRERPDPVLLARLERIEQTVALLGKGLDRTIGEVEKIGESADAMNERVSEIHAMAIDQVARGDLAAVEGRLRDEILARGKADREHVNSVAAVLRRATEGIAQDLKKQDPRETLAVLATAIENVNDRSEALKEVLAPGAVAAVNVSARISTLEASLLRLLRDTFEPRLARIDDCVQVMHVDAGESFSRADARVGEIQTGLNELLEELKKRKKGWFS